MQFKSLLKKLSGKYISLIEKHYWLTLILYLILTGFLGYHASKIDIKTRFIDLLPENKKSVVDLKKVVEYYGGEGYLIGVIEWNYIYKDTVKWIRNMEKETGKVSFDLTEALKRNDADWVKNWIEKKDGANRINALLGFYKSILEKLKGQLAKYPNEKHLNKFVQWMDRYIIKETENHWSKFKKNLGNQDQGYLLSDALELNRKNFNAYVNLILKKEGGEKHLKKVADRLAKGLEAEKDFINYVEYKFKTNFIKDNLLYFIDIPDLQDIKTRLKKKIDYERRKKLLSSSLFVDEPVKLDFQDIEDKYEKSTKVLKVTKKTDMFEKPTGGYEYYLNKDGDRLILLIKPAKESTDIGFADKLVARATKVSSQVLKDYKLSKKDKGKITIGYTGRYVKKLEDARVIKKDLKIITPLAFCIIIFSVFIYFMKLRAIFVVGIPLASGLVWATGLVKLTIGYFNIVTGFLLAILSGLGVDFAVHLFSRYVEERNRGKNIFQALETVFKTTFLSNLTSTATTAAAFFVLVISDFKGFSQFGYTAGMGMLLLLLGILFAFPSIVVIADKISPLKPHKVFKNADKVKGKRVKGYRWIVWATLIFTVFSIFGASQAKFNANFYNLAAKNTMGKKLEKKAEELIKMSLWPVIIYAKDWGTMKSITKRINDLKDAGQLSTLDKVDSFYNYIPEKQAEKKKIMLEMKDLLRDSVLSKLKGAEKKKVERLREIVEAGPIVKKDVPFELRRQFLGNKPGYFIFYYPKTSLSMSKVSTVRKMVNDIKKVTAAMEKDNQKTVVASDAMIFDDVLTLIQKEGPWIFGLVIFSIFFLLWLDFRSLKEVLVTLFPLSIGLIWIFGWTYIMGWRFNYFNIVMFPVIMGLGIDYGVHLFHRYKEDGRHNILFIIRTTGMAILIGGLTDIMGFGTLLWAEYKGLATMGQIAIAGIVSCVSAGILFMSSLLEVRKDALEFGWKKSLFGKLPKK